MLLVKTKLSPSKIDGIGLFADEDITKGTPVWIFSRGFDMEYNGEDLEKLCPEAKKEFCKYAYISAVSGKYVYCYDNARFFNHSENPNVDSAYRPGATNEEDDPCYAIVDIKKGDELTCNYTEFDLESIQGMTKYTSGERKDLNLRRP